VNGPSAQPAGGNKPDIISAATQEVRSPLVAIRHAVAVLKDVSSDQATVRRAAEIIEREVVNVDRLIGELADVSRIQLGTTEMRLKRAPLSELMERGIKLVGQFARDHDQQLSVSVSPEPVYLQMDVSRLCQALHNLIVNTCQYTQKHGHIHVRAQRNGSSVSIVICDTASTLPAAQRESMNGQVEAGLSIGLYLARHFIEAHGGTVTAVSRGENRGNELRVQLPCEASTALLPGLLREAPAVDRFPA